MEFVIAGIALALVALAIAAIRDDTPALDHTFDAPKRLPDPGARDLYAVGGITLASAPVPSWS